jgi:hypothetical protein
MATALYLLGLVAVIGALVLAAQLLHVPDPWIAVGVILMIGFVLLSLSRRYQA